MAVAVTVVAAGVVEVANMIGERELDFELSFIIRESVCLNTILIQ